MPAISIIVPAFNAAECIERAISSVCAQTFEDWEAIVVDDGSTDGTVAVATAMAVRDPRIRVLSADRNAGPSVSRNRGIEAALGQWVAMLDADDAFLPGRLQELLMLANRHQADIVADNLLFYDWEAQATIRPALSLQAGTARPVGACEFVRQSITGRSRFDYGQLKPMVRRQFLTSWNVRYPESLRHGEDFMFVMECLLAGARFVLTGTPFYLFTQRVGSISDSASKLTRTVQDLDAMQQHSIALLERPRVQRDRALKRLLEKRIRAISWHKSWSQTYPLLHNRRFVALLGAVLKDRRNAVMLAHHLFRRFAPI